MLIKMNEIDAYQQKNQLLQAEQLAKQKLTKEALQRYGNVKIAHPELAMRVIMVLLQTKETNITDQQFRKLLQLLQTEKKNISIKRV